MNFFERITKWWNSLGKPETSAEKVANKAERLESDISEAESELATLRTQLAEAIAGNRKLGRQKQTASDNASKFSNAARQAVQANNDADARAALKKQEVFEAQASALESQITANNAVIEKVRAELAEKDDLVGRSSNKVVVYKVSAKAQEIRRKLVEARSGVSEGGALGRLATFEDDLQEDSDQLDALEELSGGNSDEALLMKYAPADTTVDDKLAALKASLAEAS